MTIIIKKRIVTNFNPCKCIIVNTENSDNLVHVCTSQIVQNQPKQFTFTAQSVAWSLSSWMKLLIDSDKIKAMAYYDLNYKSSPLSEFSLMFWYINEEAQFK